jgi:hypothetical protein
MGNILRRAEPIKPLAIVAYLDKLQFWVQRPLGQKVLAQLGRKCGRGGMHPANRPAHFDPRYCQRIVFHQPSDEALRWLARREDALINYAEVTIDLVFKYAADRDEAWDFLHRHLVRRWHGTKQRIRVVKREQTVNPASDGCNSGGTRYDASRPASNRIVFYPETHSRITGEPHCLHFEWRLKGLRAIRSAGIKSGRDLSKFDYRAFWEKRLRLYAVDQRRLGRLLRNRVTGKRTRKREIYQSGTYTIDIAGRTGEVYARSYDTVQKLIDDLKVLCRVHRALIPIPNASLLPK